MTVIGTNSSALRAGNASRASNMQLQSAMERLSTGKRINSAKDDAAGLAIAQSMTAQIRGMNQAVRNANDGISLAQTADGALSETSNILQRMRELAVQSASGTYQNTDRDNMQVEVAELQKQLVSISKTEFNGVALFDAANDKVVDIQAGAGSTDTVELKISALNLQSVSGTLVPGTTTEGLTTALAAGDAMINDRRVVTLEDVAWGATMGGAAVTTADIGTEKVLEEDDTWYQTGGTDTTTGGISVGTASQATGALTALDNALSAVAETRASIGAGQSRLQSVVNNLTNNSTNLSDARSRIEDTDYSTETAQLAKAQILSQASTAMLAQANQSQQSVLKLLG